MKPLATLLLLIAAGPSWCDPGWFRDASAESGIRFRNLNGDSDQIPLLDQNGQGLAAFDYDRDGFQDLFFANGSTLARLEAGLPAAPSALWRNRGDGTFEDVTRSAGLELETWAVGVTAADIDQDGHVDLYVTCYGPNRLFSNMGDGTFRSVPDALGAGDPGWGSSASFGDLDADGDLDLVVGNYVHFDPDSIPTREVDGAPCTYREVRTGCGPWMWEGQGLRFYRNEGGRFVDDTEGSGLGIASDRRCFQVLLIDLEGDGDLDCYTGADVMPNVCLRNDGTGHFEGNSSWGGLVNGAGEHESSMGLTAGDVNGDGSPDLFMTNFAGQSNTLFVNRSSTEALRFLDLSAPAGLGLYSSQLGWGSGLVDLDLDGFLDIFFVNGHIYPQVDRLQDPEDSYAQRSRLYQGRAGGRFVEVDDPDVIATRLVARGLLVFDRENDGDLDLVIGVHNGEPRMLENLAARGALPKQGSLIELVGTRSNRDGIGAHLQLETRSSTLHRWAIPHQGFQGTQDARVHFGLGVPAGNGRSTLTVRWPSGAIQSIETEAGQVVIRVIED